VASAPQIAASDASSGSAAHAAVLAGDGPVARGEVDQPESAEHQRSARQARRGMELDEVLEHLAEPDGEPMVERGVEKPRRAGDARHERIAARRHVVHDAKADGVVRLPQIVPGEPGQREHQRDERERRWGRR
jgi:hypothetical protein